MKKIILAPASSPQAQINYRRTASRPKSLFSLRKYLPQYHYGRLRKMYISKYHTESVSIWGTSPGIKNINVGKWEKIEVGDIVLFVKNKRIISSSAVTYKIRNPSLGEMLWGKEQGANSTWDYIYFLDKIVRRNVPIEEFNDAAGYDRGYVVRGFNVLDEEKSSRIIARLHLLAQHDEPYETKLSVPNKASSISSSEIKSLIKLGTEDLSSATAEKTEKLDELTRERTEGELEEALKQYAKEAMNKSPKQISKMVTSVKRNQKLVRDMKIKFSNKCQICGFTFMMENGQYYSEAAHIIPISSRRRGVDSPDNIWILCPNHHKMLDTGALKVLSNSEYEESGSKKKLLTPSV